MLKPKPVFIALLGIIFLFSCIQRKESNQTNKINRFEVVNRHNVITNAFDSLNSLSVGNGKFAYTVDATGLQTFPEVYKNGVCLGTMSEWGWHSFPNTENFKLEEAYQFYEVEGRQVPYAVQKREGREKDASNYFRENPHRLHLGYIGLELLKNKGQKVSPEDIANINQELNLWEGKISSTFEIEEELVQTQTLVHPEKDIISVSIKSDRLRSQKIGINIRFPYPSGGHVDDATSWENAALHTSEIISRENNTAIIKHSIDSTSYFVKINWTGKAQITEKEPHYFIVQPAEGTDEFSFCAAFAEENNFTDETNFSETTILAKQFWETYWQSGGIVDFSETEDERAKELERRVILSQYLTRIQCAGNYPPQETGLTFNSWYGKFHMEMHWWHAAHWAYWNRPELLEKSLDYYFEILTKAKTKAKIQGYAGARWPKMTDNHGNDSPSGVGEFLIWQQPHVIYFVEQLYQQKNEISVFVKYLPLVQETADFMANFARWDEASKRYILGPPLIPAQESLEKEKTFNPPFELAYWHWGLNTAQNWLKRLGMPKNVEWQKVIDNLSQLPQINGKYLAAESAPDSYEHKEYYSDHPMVLGAFGMLPKTLQIDTAVMKNTFDYIEKNWNWERTWGWDYPMAAMCATRLGKPEQAIDLLLKDVLKNTYLANGHNYQGTRLRIYLPGNGGLLTAVAMMCAGYEGNTNNNPGFPDDWKVKWENLHPVF